MQAQLASGYVGQSIKVALGKSITSSRVCYIDSPSSHSHESLSLKKHMGIPPAVSSYWPGNHHGRLRLEIFPSSGPLSHPHYLLKERNRTHSSHSPHSSPATSSDSSSTKPANSENPSYPAHEHGHHDDIKPQYITTTRGTLLSLNDHGLYHEARMRGASLICHVPPPHFVTDAQRKEPENTEPVIPAGMDLRHITTIQRMAVATFEASNLKPQQRMLSQRLSSAKTTFVNDTCGPLQLSGPYSNANEQLEGCIEEKFGDEMFSVEDILTVQRCRKESEKEVGDELDTLFPILSKEDVINYETTLEAVRESLEMRWSRFAEKTPGAGNPVRPPIFQSCNAETRKFFNQLSHNLRSNRKEDILYFTEQLKPILKETRKANPRRSSNAPLSSQSTRLDDVEMVTNEEWPLIFEESPSGLPIHLQKLWTDSMSRSIILGLVLFASSTTSFPIPMAVANLLSSNVLIPLGYSPLPLGAQLLLTQLGMPVVDPLELPFLFHAAPQYLGNEKTANPLRPYPWLSSQAYQSLEDIASNERSIPKGSWPGLETISPRQQDIVALGHLNPSMCHRASSILAKSLESELLLTSDVTKAYLKDLIDASKSPEFHFSTNHSKSSPIIELPSIILDSPALLSHVDIDKKSRVNLSAIPSYAIDDKSTTEVDDAFALDMSPLESHYDYITKHLLDHVNATNFSTGEAKTDVPKPPPPPSFPQTACVLIHIADPTAAMRVGDVLEVGARERVETVYLPHRKSYMLPSILSEFYSSLRPHPQVNLALTFEAHIDLLSGRLSRMDVYPSKFNQMQRLTYEAVQSVLLQSNDANEDAVSESDRRSLRILSTIAKLRKNWRSKHGKAETMQLLKTGIKVSTEPGSKPVIQLYSEDNNEHSQSLVEEMMILVGEITGRTANDFDFAVPYRKQPFRCTVHLPSFEHAIHTPSLHNSDLPTAKSVLECQVSRMKLVHNLQTLNLLSSSDTSAIAGEHRSLGLPFYSRASSPLRRYSDIISHFQLKAWRRHGADLTKMEYSSSLVYALSKKINMVSKEIKYSQQQSERWWKNQYVLRNGMDRLWDAIVFATPHLTQLSLGTRASSRSSQYSLCILELDTILFLPTPVHLELGQIVKLKPTALSEIHLEWSVVGLNF
jgi:hypothetical protein